MAATDQKYRSQHILDIVFAVTCILMLLSVVGMFAQDYFRPFKKVQREFRDVEEAVFERSMLDKLPPSAEVDALITANKDLDKARAVVKEAESKIQAETERLRAQRVRLEVELQSLKATYDSLASLRNIDADEGNTAAQESKQAQLRKLEGQMREIQDEIDRTRDKMGQQQEGVRDTERTEARKLYAVLEEKGVAPPSARLDDIRSLSQCEDPIKKKTADFDRLAKTAAQKRFKFGDWFRALPVIDGFASPYQIQQYTLDRLPIDYNFKHVTRYDRCHSCHLGIERAAFDRDALAGLTAAPEAMQEKVERAGSFLEERRERGEDLGFDPTDLPNRQPLGWLPWVIVLGALVLAAGLGFGGARLGWPPALVGLIAVGLVAAGAAGGFTASRFLPEREYQVATVDLEPAEVTQFCAHPRLDLFVDSNSPHPGEKFGCTICHSGQGSATEFNLAAHTPSSATQRQKWADEHHWHPSHYWDFPMLAGRFVESSCLKCHHEVTDLIRYGSRAEAPKLLKGYNLARENGCFGCHEIAGIKGGRPVGPDMRLEPYPALEDLTPSERTKMLADPLNPPGKMRKVGPSLYRLGEKTREDWVRKWLADPRGFRPDTRMPHFYALSNNDKEALQGTGQEHFPDAEIQAITHYLMHESRAYLGGQDRYRRAHEERKRQLEEREKELQTKKKDATLSERERKELILIEDRLKYAQPPEPLLRTVMKDGKEVVELHIKDGEGNRITELPPPADDKQLIEGARLFRERGCLACHAHDGTEKQLEDERGIIPGLASEADFGPNLSRLADKIGPERGGPEARRAWLVQWILNPNVHFPRTRMPITHLGLPEAARIADWLLSQTTDWKGPEVKTPDRATLAALAQLYLVKAPGMTRERAAKVLGGEGIPEDFFTNRGLPLDNDERALRGPIDNDKLMYYVGRKAINRLGCFGCHNIPGFEYAKPIGTPLNDWGKKDVERLAFEDVVKYAANKYHRVPVRDDDKDKNKPAADWKWKDGKEPYEEYFFESLQHHHDQTGRVGFLHQKLLAPRSFDYNRERTWDDRLRMPQFKFARVKKRPGEKDEAFRARASQEEAEAREAVMTFVLGLVAEPIPLSYIYNPPPDRLAEAKGRQVLDKFNCAGCHQVRSGVYEFKLTSDVQKQLQQGYKDAMALTGKTDNPFDNSNAWKALPQPVSGRLLVHGVPAASSDPKKLAGVWLTQAVRLPESGSDPRSIPAGEVVELPLKDRVSLSEPYGGAFTELLASHYVMNPRNPREIQRAIPKIGPGTNLDWARAALPPPLQREGERVQPEWLFRFLLNPSVIRPQQQGSEGVMFLRMPRFNMSEEEAQALVNYFGGADRLANPALGLTYPYLPIEQREEKYWREQNQKYVKQLGPKKLEERTNDPQLMSAWTDYLQDEIAELERQQKAAEAAVQAAKEAEAKAPANEKEQAKLRLADVEKRLKELQAEVTKRKTQLEKKDFAELRRQWEQNHVYSTDAFRLLGGKGSLCLSCHALRGVGDSKAPPLDLAHGRLRPEWTLQWLGFPQRLFSYSTPMTPNFPHDKPQYQDLFEGDSLEQAKAARDVLMNLPKEAALPANRYFRLSLGGN